MAETDDLMEKKAEQSSANLRRLLWFGFAGDVVISIILVLMKDTMGLGDMVYYLALYLVVAGLAMLVFLPKLPMISLNRMRREREQKAKELEEK